MYFNEYIPLLNYCGHVPWLPQVYTPTGGPWRAYMNSRRRETFLWTTQPKRDFWSPFVAYFFMLDTPRSKNCWRFHAWLTHISTRLRECIKCNSRSQCGSSLSCKTWRGYQLCAYADPRHLVLSSYVAYSNMKEDDAFWNAFNLQATKLFIVTPATKGWVVNTPLDFVLGSRYCIV